MRSVGTGDAVIDRKCPDPLQRTLEAAPDFLEHERIISSRSVSILAPDGCPEADRTGTMVTTARRLHTALNHR